MKLVRPGLPGTVILANLLLCSSMASDVSPAPLVYHSQANEVRLMVYASDENDHPLDRLQSNDLAVVDDERVVRHFRSFSQVEETDVAVILLMDTSESVRPQFEKQIADALQLAAQLNDVSRSGISLLSFGGRSPAVLCEKDCGPSDVMSAFSLRRVVGQTPMFDAVIFAAEFSVRHRQKGARPVIILFSDGEDTVSRHSYQDAIESLVESEAVLYTADLASSGSREGADTLREMANATGGRYFGSEDVSQVLTSIVENAHAAYVLTYEPPDRKSGFHSVRVLPTRNPKLQFRCRNGYYYAERPH